MHLEIADNSRVLLKDGSGVVDVGLPVQNLLDRMKNPMLIYSLDCSIGYVQDFDGSSRLEFVNDFKGFRWLDALGKDKPNRNPFLTAADLVMLREMRIKL